MFLKQIKIKYASDDYVNICISLLNRIVALNELVEQFDDETIKNKLGVYENIYDEIIKCKTEDIILNINRYETSLIYTSLMLEIIKLVEKSMFDNVFTGFDSYKIKSYKKTILKFGFKNMNLSKGGENFE